MKKIICFILVTFFCFSLYAFEEGTFNIGGTASFSATKVNEDASSIRTISLNPQFGYFVMDNLAADLLVSITDVRQSKHKEQVFAFGLGGRYFINQIYGGLGFVQEGYRFESGSSYKFKRSGSFYIVRAGYLVNLTKNTFVDLGLHYQRGIGEYGGDAKGDNEWKGIQLRSGLQFFF